MAQAQPFDVRQYVNTTYPHLDSLYYVEQRDCGFGHWNLYGTLDDWELAKKVANNHPSQAYVRRVLHSRLNHVYYPTRTFDWSTDDLFTPVKWRGQWTDYERSRVFDLLQARDKALYPLDRYIKWRMKRSSGGTYSAWRNLFQRYIGRSFDEFLTMLGTHYNKEVK